MTASDTPDLPDPAAIEWMIEFDGLTQRLDLESALEDIHLRVAPGQVHGLLGPFISGKSSLVKLAAGMAPIQKGIVRIGGVAVDPANSAGRRLAGYMSGFVGAYDDLTRREYLAFFAAAAGVDPGAARRRIDALLELIGMADSADALIHGLALEARHRLALAKAAVHAPPVLLIDDPGKGLPLAARLRMRKLINQIQQLDGAAVLLASNILTDMATLCGRMSLMLGGRIVREGAYEEIAPQLGPFRRIELVIAEADRPAAAALLEAHSAIGSVAESEEGLIATLDGLCADPTAVIGELAAQGAAIARYRELEVDIKAFIEQG
jgi:ABC-2 type transport system ATP-binding protein